MRSLWQHGAFCLSIQVLSLLTNTVVLYKITIDPVVKLGSFHPLHALVLRESSSNVVPIPSHAVGKPKSLCLYCMSVHTVKDCVVCCAHVDVHPPDLLATQPGIILLREGTDTSQGKGQLISNINACQVSLPFPKHRMT